MLEQFKGRVEYIGSSDYYRLFFLLEGKICLKGSGFGKYLLFAREFLLLPPGSEINCAALISSRYVVLSCNGLETESNISFMEELKNIPCQDNRKVLPFRYTKS